MASVTFYGANQLAHVCHSGCPIWPAKSFIIILISAQTAALAGTFYKLLLCQLLIRLGVICLA